MFRVIILLVHLLGLSQPLNNSSFTTKIDQIYRRELFNLLCVKMNRSAEFCEFRVLIKIKWFLIIWQNGLFCVECEKDFSV